MGPITGSGCLSQALDALDLSMKGTLQRALGEAGP